jgi:hypothetical protein
MASQTLDTHGQRRETIHLGGGHTLLDVVRVPASLAEVAAVPSGQCREHLLG